MEARILLNPRSHKAILSIKQCKERNLKGIRQAFYKIGKDLKATTNKLILEKPKGGKVYRVRRGSRIIRHKASAPGEAPANLTGNLRKSLDFNVVGADRLTFGYRQAFPANPRTKAAISGGVFYGKWLELGTRKMSERPGLLKSITSNQRNTEEHFNTEIKAEISK